MVNLIKILAPLSIVGSLLLMNPQQAEAYTGLGAGIFAPSDPTMQKEFGKVAPELSLEAGNMYDWGGVQVSFDYKMGKYPLFDLGLDGLVNLTRGRLRPYVGAGVYAESLPRGMKDKSGVPFLGGVKGIVGVNLDINQNVSLFLQGDWGYAPNFASNPPRNIEGTKIEAGIGFSR